MKKKFFVILTVIVMCFAFTACGDSGTSKEDKPEIDPDAKVTLEKYEELREAKWSDMSLTPPGFQIFPEGNSILAFSELS